MVATEGATTFSAGHISGTSVRIPFRDDMAILTTDAEGEPEEMTLAEYIRRIVREETTINLIHLNPAPAAPSASR
jgi:hypothetical protein